MATLQFQQNTVFHYTEASPRVSSERGRTVVESIPQAWITDCEDLGELLKLTVDRPPHPLFFNTYFTGQL